MCLGHNILSYTGDPLYAALCRTPQLRPLAVLVSMLRPTNHLSAEGCEFLQARVSRNLGVPFWGSNNEDYSILGSILGVPFIRETSM